MSNKNNIVTDEQLHNDERISQYLRGEMSSSDEAALMDDIKSSDELRSQAVSVAYLSKATKEVGEEQDSNVKEALSSINQESARSIARNTIKNAKVKPLRRRVITIMSIAASILVLCAVGIQYFNYSYTTGLGKEYESVITSESSTVRGEENEQIYKELSALFNNVNEGKDLDATIKRLSVLWELSTMDTYNDYTDYASEIGWNLAIADLKDNNSKDAKKVLMKLVGISEDGTKVNIKAKELLNKLK